MDSSRAGPHLHVLSFNLHKGYHWLARKLILREMKKAIHEVSADIVLLQELSGERRGQEAQLEFLADTVWKNHAYGKNAVYPKGHHGNAIMSRYPIIAMKNVDISNNRFEQRGLLHAIVDLNPPQQKRLHLYCTHLNLREPSRLLQVDHILRILQSDTPPGEPLILSGDFNDWTQSCHRKITQAGFTEVHEALHGSCAKTFPSFSPFLRLDRIYTRGIKHHSIDVPKWILSDHLPLSATLGVD